MHVKQGDKVVVISGKDKGKRGVILKAFPKKDRVVVEGVNLVKKHTKPSAQNQQGGIISIEAAIHVSNVMPIDPKTGQPTRVRYEEVTGKDNKVRRVRVAAKSGAKLDKK